MITRAGYTPSQVRAATITARAELEALTSDPAVIQRWLAPRVRAVLARQS